MTSSTEARTADFTTQPVKPEHLRLVAALGAEFRKATGPRASKALQVRVVKDLPAPALCHFQTESLYFQERHFGGIAPTEVGTDKWYKQHIRVLGAGWHEWGHYHFSPRDWAAFVGSTDPVQASVAVSLEESRVEYLTTRLLQGRGGPMQSLILPVMQASMGHLVASEIKGLDADAQSWQQISSLMALIWARTKVGTLDPNDPNVKPTLDVLDDLFTPDQYDRAWTLLRAYLNIDHRALERGRHTTLVGRWIELMEEVATAAEDSRPDPGQPGDEQPGEPGQPGDEQPGEPGDEGDEGDEDGEQDGDGGGEPGDKADEDADGQDGDGGGEPDEDGDEDGDGDGPGDGEPGDDEADGKPKGKGHGDEDPKGDADARSDGDGDPLDKVGDLIKKLQDQADDPIDRNPKHAPSEVDQYLTNTHRALAAQRASRQAAKREGASYWH